MSESFDITLEEQYGIIKGTGKTVFIKTGRGGSTYGYDNKYLKLANMISKNHGFTVIVSANPVESNTDISREMNYLKNTIPSINEVVYIGFSAGASSGAQQAHTIPEIKAMLLINGPLTINYIKQKKGIEAFLGPVHMIYGEKDPSFKYIGLLEFVKSDTFSYHICESADHYFRGMEKVLHEKIEFFLNSAV